MRFGRFHHELFCRVTHGQRIFTGTMSHKTYQIERIKYRTGISRPYLVWKLSTANSGCVRRVVKVTTDFIDIARYIWNEEINNRMGKN